MEKTTTAELRKLNRSMIFRMIYKEQKTFKQEIATRLDLSLPTVSQNLKELESMHLIERNGFFESSGGRKPQAICCIRRSRVAIGVEITRHHIHIACIDLYGSVIKEEWYRERYDTTRAYCEKTGTLLSEFVATMRISGRKILGVGITLQGLVSPDGQYVSYGKILDNTGVRLSDFAEFIPYPCKLVHDVEAAAFGELRLNPQITDTVYLAVSYNLGSAIILNGSLYKGNSIGSGLIEHMVVSPGGELCYCGKRGCLETHCSLHALCGSREELADFFDRLRGGDPAIKARWARYIDTLAAAIDNIHMVIDCDVLLGGPITPYITEEDSLLLNNLVRAKCAFPETRPYVRISKCSASVAAIGTGLLFVDEFLHSI